MGWQDDPIVGEAPAAKAAWQSDPVAGAPKPKAAEPTPAKAAEADGAEAGPSILEQAITHVLGDSPIAKTLIKMATVGNPLALGEAALNLGTSAATYVPSAFAGLGAPRSEMKGATGPLDIQKELHAKATYEPKTAGGKAAMEPVALLGQLLSSAKETSGEIGGGAFGIEPGKSIGGDAIINTFKAGPDVALLVAGGRGVPAAADSFAARAASRAAQAQEAAAIRATRQATRQEATNSGYLFADEGPVGAMAKAGSIGRVAAEKIRSRQNELNATQKLRNEVGAPEGVALSPTTFEMLKQDAGAVYGDVKQVVGPELNITKDFKDALEKSLDRVNQSIDVNPSMRLPKKILTGFLNRVRPPEASTYERPFKAAPVPRLDTEWAVNQISELRQAAKGDFLNKKREAGTARLGVANQLENLIEANIGATAGTEALEAFRASRQRLAKIHLLERVTPDATGMVDLQKLGQLAKTNQYRGVLSGEFKTAADLANAYPGIVRKGTGEMIPAVTPFDAMFAVGSLAAGHPLAAISRVAPGVAASMLIK